MRTLHRVAAHETFIASGEYRYWRGEESLAISEKWTIHELQGGARFYRVDEDGHNEDGLSLISEALINPDGQIERFNLQSFNSKDPNFKNLKADYSFHHQYVQIGKQIQGEEHQYQEFPLIEDSLIYIKQTIFMGLTISEIQKVGGKAHVFSPQLFSDTDSQMQKILIKEHGEEIIQIGQKNIVTRKFQIADDVFYWLDAHNIPIQREYQHEGISYLAKIANYAHRG